MVDLKPRLKLFSALQNSAVSVKMGIGITA
jgi:hypothetical protein